MIVFLLITKQKTRTQSKKPQNNSNFTLVLITLNQEDK